MKKKSVHPIDASIGDELRSIRKQRGYSLQQVADRMGCTRALLSLYELGQISISIPQLIKLCNVYQVDYLELLKKIKVQFYGEV